MKSTGTTALTRLAKGSVASAAAILMVAAAPNAGATASVTTARLAGQNRYGTAQAVATDAAMGTPTGAIVATGQNFPDALAASTLAGANGPQPIVLTEGNAYTAEAKAALGALKAKFAGLAVTIVGGTAAVSTDVESAIRADGYTVTRVGGTDRYDSANLIARAANARQASGSVGGLKTAIFATGSNFPDALAAGPMAYRNDLPILLVSETLPDATKSAITALGIRNAIIVGGTNAVSGDVQAQIAAATGDTTVERLGGGNRYGTAAAIADFEVATLAFPMTTVVLATAQNFPDALSAGVLAGVVGGAIVLVDSPFPGEAKQLLVKYSSTVSRLLVAGGTTVIDDAAVEEAKKAAQGT